MSELDIQSQNSLAVADKSIHAQLKLHSQQGLALHSWYLGRIRVKRVVLLSPNSGPVVLRGA